MSEILTSEQKYMRSIDFGTLYPKSLMLEFTNLCNLNCVFCPNFLSNFREKGLMQENLIKKIIQETPSHTRIIVCGFGEPTLHDNFGKYVDLLSEKFFDMHLVTNGQFGIDILDFILKTRFRKVTFSLDYFDYEEYNINKNGDIKIVLNNIELLLERRDIDTVVQINMIAEKGKEDQIINCLLYFNKMLKNGDFVYSRGIKSLAEQINVNQIQNYDDWFGLAKFKEDISWVVDTSKFFVENWVEFLGINGPLSHRLVCRHPFIYTVVFWDGRTTFCCVDFNGKNVSGDLNNQNLEQIWNGNNYFNFRKDMAELNFINKPLCNKCKEWYKQKWE